MKISFLLGILLATFFVHVRGQACGCDDPLRVATFNTFQIPVSPAQTERLNETIAYFDTVGSDFDIVCFNELWEADKVNTLLGGINSQYPYSVTSAETLDASTCATAPVCSTTEMESFVGCVNVHNCAEATDGTSFYGCVIENCQGELDNVTAPCRDCITSTNNNNTIENVFTNCAGLEEVSPGIYSSCQLLFGGRSDNVLVSKYEFTDSGQLFYNVTPFVAWGAVYGRIVHPIYGPVFAFCTHLVPDQGFVDFSQENAAQMEELINRVRDVVPAGGNETVLIMGDFHAGPQVDGNAAELDANYRLILNAGFADAAVIYAQNNNLDVNCTVCDDNPLSDDGLVGDRDRDIVIDHIFINEDADFCVAEADRFLTERAVTVEDPGDDDELDVELIPVSDHYAVRASFCRSSSVIGPSPPAPGDNTSIASAKFVSGAVALMTILIAFITL